MSLIEKIDERIKYYREFYADRYQAKAEGLEIAKEIILSQQKESATDINVTTKTIGDKIRESNESLANEIMKFGQRCYDCDYKEKPECNVKSCKDGILEYLNQPYTE
jgi:hypothetical protein